MDFISLSIYLFARLKILWIGSNIIKFTSLGSEASQLGLKYHNCCFELCGLGDYFIFFSQISSIPIPVNELRASSDSHRNQSPTPGVLAESNCSINSAEGSLDAQCIK